MLLIIKGVIVNVTFEQTNKIDQLVYFSHKLKSLLYIYMYSLQFIDIYNLMYKFTLKLKEIIYFYPQM